MHQAAYRALGLNYRYMALEVPPGEVPEALDHLAGLGYRGANVTIPHKHEALDWCTTSDAFARRVGAANTIDLTMRSCINTDAPGFLATLTSVPANALIIGAGGSARALCVALHDAGTALAIYNRTRQRAADLISDLGIEAELLDELDPEGSDVIVNTTPTSLSGERLPVLWDRARPDALAYDLVYGPSPFLRDAENHGLRTQDGLALLVEQGALALRWWLGIDPPRDVMMEAVRC
jgi:shikimate dehydrogenase